MKSQSEGSQVTLSAISEICRWKQAILFLAKTALNAALEKGLLFLQRVMALLSCNVMVLMRM